MRSARVFGTVLVVAVAAGCGGGTSSPSSTTSSRGVPGSTFTVTVRGEAAYFDAATATTVFLPAGGRVTAPGGIDCGIAGGVASADCQAEYPWGNVDAPTTVALTATPDAGAGFGHYTFAGSCIGSDPCTVAGNADKLVVVRFARTKEGLGGHPNLSDGAVHGPMYRAFAAGTPGALQCTSCHGAVLQGQGIALGCGTCHSWPRRYTIGGTVAGLQGSGLVLRNTGADDLAIAASGSFAFATPVTDGAAYAVTVAAQPTSPPQICEVLNGTGSVGSADVTSVEVRCRLAGSRIAAGVYHGVAIRPDGTLWAWGLNNYGQVGDGTTTPRRAPVRIGSDADWASVAAGHTHTLAVKRDGTLWAWGSNFDGALGDGTGTSRLAPVQIGSGYALVSGGFSHSLAVKTDGTLWAWGGNGSGQLGDGTTTRRLVPVQIGSGYAAVAAGDSHGIAVKADGTLWAWGWNAQGQLGDGTTTTRLAPVQIGSGYAAVAAGVYHGAALKTDGTLWTWGSNSFGQLGDGTTTARLAPVQIASGYASVSTLSWHTVGLKTDGTLWTWGLNSYGEIGDGTTSSRLAPVQVAAGHRSVAAGHMFTAAEGTDGAPWAWGLNTYGQLGDPTNTFRLTPAPVGLRALDVNAMIAAGLASATSTALDIGSIANVFDGSTATLARSANVNPMEVEVTFSAPQTIWEFRTYFSAVVSWMGSPAYRWQVETADSAEDLAARSGSYRVAVPDTFVPSDSTGAGTWTWFTLPSPVVAKVFRLTGQRLVYDSYVHLNEWVLMQEPAW